MGFGAMKLSESTHRQTFIDEFRENIQDKSYDTNLTFPDAAVRVVLEWLGYEIDDSTCIDSGDRGIDAWVFTESTDPGLDIFQVKTHRPSPDGLLCLDPFDGSGVNDLQRAKNFLLYEDISTVQNTKLQSLLRRWNSVIHERKQRENETPLQITLNLVIIGEKLTPQAQQEFNAFSASNAELVTLDNGIVVQFHAVLYTINEIIDRKWRETNREWRDLHGQKKDYIELTPLNNGYISDNKRRYVKLCVNLWAPAYLAGIAIFLNFKPRMTA